MPPVIGQDFFLILSVSLITVVVLATGYVRYCYGYWKRKNVPYLEPKFPFGNSTSLFPKGIAIGAVSKSFYDKFKSMGHAVGGSCAFGIDCNSFKHPDAEFRTMGRKLFGEFSFMDRLNLFLSIYAPKLSQKLGVRNIQKDISRFFFHSIKDTVSHRERNNLRRNDLLQLLIDLKNSDVKLSMNELIAQVFLFFSAGFETSSSTTSLALFEISKNHEAQKKLHEEIVEVLGRHGGNITYDAIAEMKYLGQAVDETLRLWPPVATISRVCTKDYRLQGTDITVEKDTMVLIPALGLHHDPDLWPDAERWDPDRFSEENKQNRRPFTHLPFGEGPRNCIGLRFGLLQTKIALVTVLRDYRVSLSPKTIVPLGVDPETFVLRNINRVYLLLHKI